MPRIQLTRNLRSAFTDGAVEQYLYNLLPASHPVLAEMERYAAKHDVPIIGPAVARLLALLVKIAGAKRIFEMGSAIGYSTIWLAQAAGPSGRVYYTDGDPEKARRAAAYFKRAGVASRITILVGDSATMLARTPGKFDLIFCDVDKHQYPASFRKAVPRLKRGGLFVADNVLWSGRVTRKANRADANTRGIRQFNRLLFTARELEPVIVPLRDGIAIARTK
ncbi:MAG: O-methyltransferase [Candidatus Acidiferrales bacterium]